MIKFSRNFWTVISMELLERGSYYSIMSVLAIYLSLSIGEGGLGFSKDGVGLIQSIITPLTFLVPIVSGALAEKYGYKKSLVAAFILMGIGYFFSGTSTEFNAVLLWLVVMSIGSGAFKPVVAGTLAHETNPKNSSLGFGIFYMSINVGAFVFPLFLVPYLKEISWSYIFYMASIVSGVLMFINFAIYKEPHRPKSDKTLMQVIKSMGEVILDRKFMTLVVIYSGFWILYFQMFGTVLWYLNDHVSTYAIDRAVNSFLSIFVDKPSWKFDVEHVTVLNTLTIISLQLVISNIANRFKAMPTMITGIALGTVGMAILAISSNIWIFIAGVAIFSIGEMTAQPKYISYVSIIAPSDKKALYMGYSSLTNVIGGAIAGVLGASMYEYFEENMIDMKWLWLAFAAIGVVTMIGLLIFNKKVKTDA